MVPLQFLTFCDRMDVGKSQRVPHSVFFGIAGKYSIFLPKTKGSPLIFFDNLQHYG